MLLHMMRNNTYSETALMEETCRALRNRLPTGWDLTPQRGGFPGSSGRSNTDGVLILSDPQGITANIVVEAKPRPVEARQVSVLADRWARQRLPQSREVWGPDSNVIPMVVAPFLGPSARERLAEAGISFADATGNLRLVITRPAVFIEALGAVRNPWRENLPLRSLGGSRSGRIVRAFLDYQPPFGTREIASLTGNAPASVSRVADLLEREAIIQREHPRGPVSGVEWERLLRRWALDYDFSRANRLTPCLEARGPTALIDKLRDVDFTYTVTGSFAAVRHAPVAEPRLVIIYTPHTGNAMTRLGVRPADSGANVLIGEPFDPVVFDRTEGDGGITFARVTQVAVDLMRGPGRGPAEAESLMDWMRSQEEAWRLIPSTPTT